MTRTPSVAFFDFDGTITDRDIFWDYISYRRRHDITTVMLMKCIPFYVRYALGIWSNEVAKEKIFGMLFRDEPVSDFKRSIEQYTNDILPLRLRQKAIDRINWHRQNGDDIFVVTANFDLLLANFIAARELRLIATRLDISGDRLTGKFATPNCYGAEKVNRINEEVPNLHMYANIYCYGDSKGDLQMLDIATYKFFKPFRPEE